MSVSTDKVNLPADVIANVDALVGPDRRDDFLAMAVARAVDAEKNRRQIRRILLEEGPIWKEEHHPELAGGVAEYVHTIRSEEGRKRDEAVAQAWTRD